MRSVHRHGRSAEPPTPPPRDPTPLIPSPRHFLALPLVVAGSVVLGTAEAFAASVALMSGQSARPLHGRFNRTPVLHSNQPEEVEGPGILVSTTSGHSIAAENGAPLRNATYTFNGEFGLHFHHKYFPPYRASISPRDRRTELTIAAIAVNPGSRPVRILFQEGAVRNSFEAPYLANHLLGVKPLGPRPWNTGPGDATAVLMLRGRLDRDLQREIVIPPRGRVVMVQTDLPALGIANALLRGRSDGPFQMAVVAARRPQTPQDVLAVLDAGRLAPGRVYLDRLGEIRSGRVFSRVGGVALGDRYEAALSHDLRSQGPLHVPLTSTSRIHFGTRDVQVNPLATRMVDSAVDNVGTYGVRFDIDLNLRGNGSYDLVMSHPALPGVPPFTAFRGSLQIRIGEELREVHVGLRSGQSLSLASLDIPPGRTLPVRVSLVYPADATPGHLLSVVPSTQLARLNASPPPALAAPPTPVAAPRPAAAPQPPPVRPPAPRRPPVFSPPPVVPPPPLVRQASPVQRYREAVDAQRRRLEELRGY